MKVTELGPIIDDSEIEVWFLPFLSFFHFPHFDYTASINQEETGVLTSLELELFDIPFDFEL